jgi:predicted nucleotidyltransferase
MKKARQEIVEILRQALPELSREFGVRRLAIFGSYARGDATHDSDVDVLVEFDPSLGLRFVDLAERIEALLGMPADVVSRRAVSARHWAEIEPELLDVA